jgi:hypothetical protein
LDTVNFDAMIASMREGKRLAAVTASRSSGENPAPA